MDNYIEFIGNTPFKENRLHLVQKNMTPGRCTKNIALHFFYCGHNGHKSQASFKRKKNAIVLTVLENLPDEIINNYYTDLVKPPRIEGSPA